MSNIQQKSEDKDEKIPLNKTNSRLLRKIKLENKKFMSSDLTLKNQSNIHDQVKKIIISSQSQNFMRIPLDFGASRKQAVGSIGAYFKAQKQNIQDIKIPAERQRSFKNIHEAPEPPRKMNNVYYNQQKIEPKHKISYSHVFDSKNYVQDEIVKQKSNKISCSQVIEYGQMCINMFQYSHIVGKGGFGKMSKSKIIAKKSVNSVMNERNLLSQLKHPFLVNMNYAFQDREYLYLVMDLLSGGDLRYHISKFRRFSEIQTQFFVCCILQSLSYLHTNNIIHRDIKPENLVLDRDGYVRITDLGIARVMKDDNSQDTSGTPGYMSPEVMCRQNHGFGVDYYALGVIVYEFMMGRRPYNGRSRKEIRDQILARQVQIKKNEIPYGWSIEAADFANKLLQRKPQNRLGAQGSGEVMNHPWIKNYPWRKLYSKQLDAPFMPGSVNNHIEFSQICSDENLDDDIVQQNNILLRKQSVQSLFSGYNYDAQSKIKHLKNPSTGSTNDTSQNQTIAQEISFVYK